MCIVDVSQEIPGRLRESVYQHGHLFFAAGLGARLVQASLQLVHGTARLVQVFRIGPVERPLRQLAFEAAAARLGVLDGLLSLAAGPGEGPQGAEEPDEF